MSGMMTTDARQSTRPQLLFSMTRVYFVAQFAFFHFSSKLTAHVSKIRDTKQHCTQRWTDAQGTWPCDSGHRLEPRGYKLRKLTTTRNQERNMNRYTLWTPKREATPPTSWFWTSSLQIYKNKFMMIFATQFWALVTAAPGNKYSDF